MESVIENSVIDIRGLGLTFERDGRRTEVSSDALHEGDAVIVDQRSGAAQ